MPLEIEWRFLVTKLPALPPVRCVRVQQTYLTTEAPVVRVRVIGDRGKLTIKGGAVNTQAEGPVAREEFEYDIPVEQARALLGMTPFRIEKTRYYLDGGMELDVFEGRHAGLVIAEVEVAEAGAAPRPPAGWEWRDVSHDGRYSNQALAVEGIPEDGGR